MKTTVIGAAVVTGYALGRFHKMKWALGLAAAAGGKRLAGGLQGGMLGQAAEKAGVSSPVLGKLTGDMRGRLVEAGKAAAVTAVSRRIDSLSEGLQARTESLLEPGGKGGSDTDNADDAEDTDDTEDMGDSRDEGRDARGSGEERRGTRRPEDRQASDQRPARPRHADSNKDADGKKDSASRPARRRPAQRGEGGRPASRQRKGADR